MKEVVPAPFDFWISFRPFNGMAGGTNDRDTGGHIGNFEYAPFQFEAFNVLNLINPQEFDATLVEIQRQFHQQDLLVVVSHKGMAALQNHAPQEWPGSLITDGSLNADDRNTIPLLFRLRQVVEDEPVQVGCFPHARFPSQQEIASLPKRSEASYIGNFGIELSQIRRHEKEEGVEPEQPLLLGQAHKLPGQLFANPAHPQALEDMLRDGQWLFDQHHLHASPQIRDMARLLQFEKFRVVELGELLFQRTIDLIPFRLPGTELRQTFPNVQRGIKRRGCDHQALLYWWRNRNTRCVSSSRGESGSGFVGFSGRRSGISDGFELLRWMAFFSCARRFPRAERSVTKASSAAVLPAASRSSEATRRFAVFQSARLRC